MLKRIISFTLALAMMLALMSCGNQSNAAAGSSAVNSSDASISTTVEAGSSAPVEGVEETIDWTNVNPLTGEATETDISKNRPVAVMLNNVKQALPQSGNSKADVIYEVPEEGGVTRIMAVFQDINNVGTLGSIRSTRPYYVRLALAADAILVHAGGSNTAYDVIKKYMRKSTDFDDIDCLEKGTNCAYEYFWRDQDRINSGFLMEHTLFTSSENIQKYMADNPDLIRPEHQSTYSYAHEFVEDGTPVGGSEAKQIQVEFSGYKTGVFDYDESTGKYLVSEYDAPYTDGATGDQVSVTNVFVILTDISVIDGDTKGRLSVTLTGTGSGFYACGGQYIPITWVKDDVRSNYVFYDQNGEVLKLGVGKSYVNILDKARDITVDGTMLEKPADANADSAAAVDSMAQAG